MRIITVALITFATFTAAPANAELISTAPSEVCAYLKDWGLATRGWKNHYGDVFGCSSPYKELGSGYPLANNIAFYAEGNASAVTQAKLVLNVNNRESASTAHEELLKGAEVLVVKAAGEQLPQSLKDAIKSGEKTAIKVGSSSVEVLREEWPTGKGYEVKVVIK